MRPSRRARSPLLVELTHDAFPRSSAAVRSSGALPRARRRRASEPAKRGALSVAHDPMDRGHVSTYANG